jgi:hypothetical protein
MDPSVADAQADRNYVMLFGYLESCTFTMLFVAVLAGIVENPSSM